MCPSAPPAHRPPLPYVYKLRGAGGTGVLPASVCLQPCVCSWPHWPGTCQAFKLLPPRPAPTLKGKWSVGEALVSLPHHHYHLQVIVCTKLLVPVMFEGGGGSSQDHYVMGAHISWTMDGGIRPGWRPYVCRPSCTRRANLVTSVSRLFPPHAVGGGCVGLSVSLSASAA